MLIDDSSFITGGLDGSPIFSEFSLEEKKQLADQAVLCHYAQGTIVFSADHDGDAFYLVISGILRIRLKNRKMKECHAGQIFGEVAIFENRTRMGTIHVQEAAMLAKFNKTQVFSEDIFPSPLRAKLVTALTRQIISYLYNDLPLSSREMMMKGESENIEFKASANSAHFTKIIITLAAMMNAQGGSILLGVEDGGGLVGVRLKNTERDVLVRSLNTLIRKHLGGYASTLVLIDAEIIDGREIIRIDCEPSKMPVFFVENEDEIFYVRVSRENIKIRTVRDCIQYIKKRFTDLNFKNGEKDSVMGQMD